MNPTRWAFLYHGIQRNELQQMEIFQGTLAKSLGLNLFPLRDEKTGKLRLPETFSEMTPLVIAGSPGYIASLPKLWDEMTGKDDVGPISDVPVQLDTDTGLEILDRPFDPSKLSEAERRQLAASVGIVQEKPPVVFDEDVPQPKTSAKKGSFSLDD